MRKREREEVGEGGWDQRKRDVLIYAERVRGRERGTRQREREREREG